MCKLKLTFLLFLMEKQNYKLFLRKIFIPKGVASFAWQVCSPIFNVLSKRVIKLELYILKMYPHNDMY